MITASGILICDVHLWFLRDAGEKNFPLYLECSKVFGNTVGQRVREIASVAEYLFTADDKSVTVLVRDPSGPTVLVGERGDYLTLQLYPVLHLFKDGFVDAEFNDTSFRLRRYS